MNTHSMKKQFCCFACLLTAALALLCSSCSKGPNPHLKRGDDWLKMSDYTQAASEYGQAVTEEPSNVEGHTGLVRSLLGLHRYGEALNEIDVVKRLDPTGTEAAELTKLTEGSIIQLFNSPNSGMTVAQAMNNLDLLRKIGSSQSVALLKTLMGNSSAPLAAKAESILQALSPSDVEPTLNALLDSADAEVKMRTAERLWKENKNEEAGNVLLATAESEVTSAGRRTSDQQMSSEATQAMEKGLQDMDALGYSLAKEFYKKVISSSENYRWELVTACIKKIAAAHDSGMKDDVVAMLRKGYMSDPKNIISSSPTQEALDYLASVGDKSFVPQVKSVLAYYVCNNPSDSWHVPNTISLLSRMDGKKWESFQYVELRYLVEGVNGIAGQQPGSKTSIIDQSPEDAESIATFIRIRGAGDRLSVGQLEIVDADRMKWHCSIFEGNSRNVLYTLDMIFRGTGVGQRPWLLTKVDNIKETGSRIGGSDWEFLRSGKAKLDQKDYDGAIADFDKGLLWSPNDRSLHLNRGWARAFKGDYEGAFADAESAGLHAGLWGDADAGLLYGFAKLQQGDKDGAIAQFDTMIQRGQNTATAYNWRAVAKERKGDLDGAIQDYRRAIDTDPKLKDELQPKIEKDLAKQNETGGAK
jgi:tetratricopeptide (TPR) repeat protein